MRTNFISALLCLLLVACAGHEAVKPYPVAGDPQQVVADMAALLQDPSVAPMIEQHYDVQFINVGYLPYIREYVSLYNVPVIYTTPTVMVVDPHSNTLLNRRSLPYWGTASSRQPQDAQGVTDIHLQFPHYALFTGRTS